MFHPKWCTRNRQLMAITTTAPTGAARSGSADTTGSGITTGIAIGIAVGIGTGAEPEMRGYSRSNTAAMPCPPPIHIVTNA